MERHDEEIIAQVGKIIVKSGIESLSPERLARDLNIDQQTLPCHCETTEEILLTMLESLERELNQLVNTAKQQNFSSGANSGSIRTPIPETSGRAFWYDPDTYSGNIRTPVPGLSGQ